jgi:hypothetical protein
MDPVGEEADFWRSRVGPDDRGRKVSMVVGNIASDSFSRGGMTSCLIFVGLGQIEL